MYIALFSHFIACGVWEAVYILDGLLKNKSTLQPDTLYADTHGRSDAPPITPLVRRDRDAQIALGEQRGLLGCSDQGAPFFFFRALRDAVRFFAA